MPLLRSHFAGPASNHLVLPGMTSAWELVYCECRNAVLCDDVLQPYQGAVLQHKQSAVAQSDDAAGLWFSLTNMLCCV